MRRFAVVSLAVFLSAWACAQTAAPAAPASGGTAAGAKHAAGNQGALVEHTLFATTWNADGTGTSELTATILMQSPAGVSSNAVLALPYVRGVQTLEVVSVNVRQPDGTVIATPSDNVEDMPGAVTQTAPMYSDLREKHVIVKGLDVGDTLTYDVRWHTVKPRWPGEFWTDYNFPAIVSPDQEVSVSVPSAVAVQVSSPGLPYQQQKSGTQTTYRWKYARTADETGTPPTLVLTSLKSWAQVGAWYQALAQPQQAVTPAMQAKAAALTQGLSTEQAKIEALYKFVSTHIHYVALELGAGAYQPHTAGQVLENGYGDCKDQQTLLGALLQAVGVQSWPALINASGAKLVTAAPTPAQFDHVITVVPRGEGKQDWLDTTAGVAPYGMLLANLRDEQALVIPMGAAAGPAALMTTPADPPFPADVHFDAEGKLDNQGTLTAHVTESMRGDAAVLLRLAFRLTPSASWPKVVQTIIARQGFGGDATNVTASDPEDTSVPEQWSFDYTRSDYPGWSDHAISAFLMPLGIALPDKAPTDPIPLGAPGTRTIRSRISLPAGYTPTLPKPTDLSNAWLDYHAHYTFADGVLTSEREVVVKEEKAPASAYAELSKMSQAMVAEESASIALNSPAGAAPGSDLEALMQAATQAMRARQFDVAIHKLQQLVKLRPRDPQAWGYLGAAYGSDYQLDKAARAFQTQIEVNPDNQGAQVSLAMADIQLGKPDEARAQLQHEVALHPSDTHAQQMLSAMQTHQLGAFFAGIRGRSAGTASGGGGLAALQDALKAGDAAATATAVTQAVAADPTPLRLIQVAHLLAASGTDLDQARQYASSAIPSLEMVLHGMNVDTVQPAELSQVATLGSGWSTLGWIELQQGDLADAADDLNAAWNLNQSPEAADHLAQVYQKQGRRADAERLYADAVAASNATAASAADRALKALVGTDQAAALVNRERGAISESRMIEIPAKGLPTGSAQFFISFEPGPKVDGVKFASGDSVLAAAVPALTAARYRVVFPKGHATTLVRQGELDCEPGAAACDFVLLPVPDALAP